MINKNLNVLFDVISNNDVYWDYQQILDDINKSLKFKIVESPVEEVKEMAKQMREVTESPFSGNSVTEQQKGKIYKTKKEFIDEMTTAYTNELLRRGLDPMFAKYLVAQDGLESNWGKSSLGYYNNYGGIKEIRPGKGVAKPTNEFINGKMEKVSGNFREFSSLQDYVKYKVGLLNNSRYRAFSSHPGDFIFRVVGGGYATDPEYVNKFNRHLNSFQNGGVLQRRVITPAEVEAKKERTNDIIRDKNILANLVKEDSALLKLFPNSALANFIANRYIQRINDTAVKVGSKDTTGRSGFIEVNDLNDKSAIKKGVIKLTKDIVEAAIKRRSGDLNKVISELDTIRNKYPNGHALTKEELVNEKRQLNADSELTKLGMDLGFLLDHLAHNATKKESDIVYAQKGKKMSGIPYANLIDDPAEHYNYSVDGTYDPKTKHYSSRDPKTGLVLKGIGHPTRRLAYKEDQKLGYDWYEGYDGNTYSYDLFEAAGKPIFTTPMTERQVITGKKSQFTLNDLHNLINRYKHKHGGVWTDNDIKYFYDKAQTTRFSPEAIAYVTATEASFNPNAKNTESSARGLGQLTNARLKQLMGSKYTAVKKQYSDGSRSIKDQIDDLMLNINQIDNSITSDSNNLGYGRLKINYLKPSWSINRKNLKNLDLETNLTRDQRSRITENSSVRDLIEEYDNEFSKKFGYESK